MSNRILIFGDSIVWGACDEEGGWTTRVKRLIDKKRLTEGYSSSVYPLGISGDTTEDLLKRFNNETKARLDEDSNLVIIFAIGINDTQVDIKGLVNKISVEEFRENIKELVNQARKHTQDIIFIGLTPVDQRVNPMSWKPTHAYLNEQVAKYNRALQNVVKTQGVPFIELYSEMLMENYMKLLEDGLHPNTKGHEFIYNKVIKYLEENEIV